MNEEIMKRIFESGQNALVFEGDRLGICLRKDFDKIQKGFRCDNNGRKHVDWPDKYYVVGFDTMDNDPLIIDVTDKRLPIYYMYQDDYEFKNLFKIANSVEDYIEICQSIMSANLYDAKETKRTIKTVNGIAPLKSHKYWSNLIEIIHQNLNY